MPWTLAQGPVDWSSFSDSAPPPVSDWAHLPPHEREQLDALYWGDDHLHPGWGPGAWSYTPPLVATGMGIRGVYSWKDDETRAQHFAEQWKLYRIGFGLSLAQRRRGGEQPGALRAKVTSTWPGPLAREWDGEPAFPIAQIAEWLPAVPPGPVARPRSRWGADAFFRGDDPGADVSGYAMRQLQEEARRRYATPVVMATVQEFLASPAYRLALTRAFLRLHQEGVGAGAREALLVGGPSAGQLVPVGPGHTYVHTAAGRAADFVHVFDQDSLTPLPTNHYRRSGVRLPDGTSLYAYVPPGGSNG